LLAMALACGAYADNNNGNNNNNNNGNNNNNNGQIHSVPDGGATAVLLGLSVVVFLFAKRKFEIVK
jgi:hypothetical protein